MISAFITLIGGSPATNDMELRTGAITGVREREHQFSTGPVQITEIFTSGSSYESHEPKEAFKERVFAAELSAEVLLQSHLQPAPAVVVEESQGKGKAKK